jgi:hypothetical protein
MLPTAVLLSSLPAQLCQLLGMSMAEAQFSFYNSCLTWVTSLRSSFAPLLAPLLRAFPALSLIGGTLPCPCNLLRDRNEL